MNFQKLAPKWPNLLKIGVRKVVFLTEVDFNTKILGGFFSSYLPYRAPMDLTNICEIQLKIVNIFFKIYILQFFDDICQACAVAFSENCRRRKS